MSNFPVNFTETELEENYQQLYSKVMDLCDSRRDELHKLYSDNYENMVLAPASSVEHYHNAFPGGYVDHVLRVMDFTINVYEMYQNSEMDISDFSVEELLFVAAHHDLGKLGFSPNKERYVWNESEWHRNNLGQLYKSSDKIPFTVVPHLSLYTLQEYNVKLTWNEWQGILIHDGLYEKMNESYFLANRPESRLKSLLPHIVHTADMMASQFEYKRWYDFKFKKPKKVKK
jgi:hypothetical protein